MFGDLFEEDFSFISNNHYGKGKKSKPRESEPPAPRDFTNLSGIKNQGGTCYLNSLLQTLLFTPEFREALFSLGPEELGTLDDSRKPDAKVRIIPLQLQRLFAQLLLLDQQAASTADLTESFGWSGHEEMRQHDVQELNRILFSALETSLVGTSGHDLINRLYHGIVVNQIVCKECKNVSERQEDFLDLTVAVKGVAGLEEALWNMYVEEEYFENDNLYRCGACDKLVEASKLFLYFMVGSDQSCRPEMEIVVEETASVRECLNLMLEKSGLSGDNWHLRRLDWCYEAGEALSQENATLKELNVCRGDTLVITEGKLPEKGFLKIPIWWLKPSGHKKHGENAQDQVNGITWKMEALQVSAAAAPPEPTHPGLDLCYAGRIEIAGEASLEDLKMQVLTLPCCQEQVVPLPLFLRAWTLDSKRPGKLLRDNKRRLSDYRLGARVEICIEPLQEEENLGPHELLLRVQMGIPGERDYSRSQDLVWDISKECTTWALRQRVASHYCLPVDKIEIAKYFPERFEWLPISSWTQQISKRKRRKKQASLQSAPYHLKDGDIIGVKNLLLDDTKDFSTVRDDIGKEKQRQLALEKRKSRQERVQDPLFPEEKLPTKPRKPEVALSINVGVFR
ncbi:ubiquitin carboxyl-terminal hydrolase 40 isoform X5 [Vidua chalybeata]|uniref:ubiquitin carboxyl-terminal hydrolase 40 isoform X5 n=1 Tax=Vidua chalybeata TaxID=81927 RepID=UPI0023A8DE70|nr:ubiquitin carboxyl-terminal hydrolase 40 isoform X5 [Vidua chalybeata]